jgi:FG-GAP-like repeat
MNSKNSSSFFRIVTRFCFLTCVFAAGAIHAQPFSPASPFPGVHEHKALPASVSATALVTSLNAEGALGFAYMYDSAFGGGISPPVSSLFVRNTARPKTHSYKTQPAPTTAAALVTLLNAEGALGFRYFGDMTFDATLPSKYTVSLFTKDNSGATYTYKQLPPASSEATFLAQVNAEGANGFAYVSDVAYPSGGGFLIASLFVKENSSAAVYSYESRPSAVDVTAFLAQANAQGIRGFRYRGDLFVGSSLFSLFMKNSTAQYRFVFEARTPQATAAAYVTQSNAEGARGFVYAGDFAFGGFPTTISSFYVAAVGTARDANGDGNSDLTFRNTTTGELIGFLMNGGAVTSGASLLGPGPWTIIHTADLNGDGKADLIYRNLIDGTIVVFLMNGLSVINSTVLFPAGTPWNISQTGDFNGDGKADLLLRNNDGSLVVWTMDGLSVTGGALVLGAASGFTPTHVADFNGDGKADILLRNVSNGSVVLFTMNGISVTSGGVVLGASSGYTPTHTGDLNGDGKADILFRNDTDGSIVAFLMNGAAVTGSAAIVGAGNWRVNQVADYNGDGKADLLLRNNDGTLIVFTMNGTAVTGSGVVLGANTVWNAVQGGDYNGDGKADIILRNNDGTIVMFLMNGTAVTTGATILTAGPYIVVPTLP